MSCHEPRFGLRPIEEEIFEVLFYLCNERNENERVKMKEILETTNGLSKTQLTNIIRRKLEPQGLIDYLPYSGVLLTKKGYIVGKEMQRKHRLAEALLGNILGLDWEVVHNEACCLEHSITETIAEAILAKIGSPPLTPYGYPVPDKSSERVVTKFNDISLHDAPLNEPLILKRARPVPQLIQELRKGGIRKIETKLIKIGQDSKKYVLLANNKKLELDINLGKTLFVTIES